LSAGQIARYVYDQFMINNTSIITKQEALLSISSFQFQPSVPNNKIGDTIQSGFFDDTKLFVRVLKSTDNPGLHIFLSKNSYLSSSEHMDSFLRVPLIPFELSQTHFFTILQERGLINNADYQFIEQKLSESSSILILNEFIQLVHYLSTSKITNEWSQRILSVVRFRETIRSDIIIMKNFKFYDPFNVPSVLKLPQSILSASIAVHFSGEELQSRLYLTPWSLTELIDYYLHADQRYIFLLPKANVQLLSLFSKQLYQFQESEWNKIQLTLSGIKCIQTTRGMKIPSESYIPSKTLSSYDIPIIKFNTTEEDVNDSENNYSSHNSLDAFISIEFLKRLGCRTFHLGSFVESQSLSSNETMEILVPKLMQERKNMTDADFSALKQKRWLQGTAHDSTGKTNRQCVPQELYFPSVAIELNWPTLLVIDWPDIKSTSQQYLFLKQLGVREVPDLPLLIDRISQEHNAKSSNEKKNQHKYQLPKALSYFIKYFQQHYSSLWTTTHTNQLFLPSRSPTTITNDDDADNNNNHRNNQVILSKADQLFQDDSPLCNTLLPQVMELFSKYSFDIARFNIKKSPSIDTAFGLFMERKNELLFTIESTRKIFAYLNQVYEWNEKRFNEYVSRIDFIPLQGSTILKKPCEVFIRSDNMISVESSINNVDTSGLIDYVDFGEEGNSFLKKVGVCCWPSASVLAQLLLDRQANYFRNSNQNIEMHSKKMDIYLTCLQKLAGSVIELNEPALVRRLQTEPWCLGYELSEDKNDSKMKLFRIVSPQDVYLNDNNVCAVIFHVLCAPDDRTLSNLYKKFGSNYLSKYVTINSDPIGVTKRTGRGDELQILILERLDILFIDKRRKALPNLNNYNVELIRKTLVVCENTNIRHQMTFKGNIVTLQPIDSSSCVLVHKQDKVTLYLREDEVAIDLMDVAVELSRFTLGKNHEFVYTIKDLLSATLRQLEQRGVRIDLLKKNKQQTEKLMMNTPKISDQDEQNTNKMTDNSCTKSTNTIPQTKDASKDPKSSVIKEERRPKLPVKTSKQQPLALNVECNYKPKKIPDFSVDKQKKEKKVLKTIKNGQPYISSNYTYPEYKKEETNIVWQLIPTIQMKRYKDAFHSIPLFLSENVNESKIMMDEAKQLAWILINLARHVFEIPTETIHLYQDVDGGKVKNEFLNISHNFNFL
ncbi:unnamed protein product, partial [Adineta steineri]